MLTLLSGIQSLCLVKCQIIRMNVYSFTPWAAIVSRTHCYVYKVDSNGVLCSSNNLKVLLKRFSQRQVPLLM